MTSSVIIPTLPDRKRRRSMSRRPGQDGRIELRKGVFYARFWLDVAGQPKRIYKRVRICPASGPGALNASERARRLKDILVQFGANSEEVLRKAEAADLGTTFEQQAEIWLTTVQTRKRSPIKPRTAETWRSHLDYINEKIGPMPLSEVNNRTMREFVSVMSSEIKKDRPRFSAKSIDSYLGVIKSVVASVLNEKGEPVYPVTWDNDFMDVPVIEDQNTPTFTAAEVETIISKAEGQYRILYALLAGSGLRIGEAFALTVEDVRGSVLHVKGSAWEGTVSSPKTKNGTREVDIHSSLAELLEDHLAGRSTGYVFQPSRKSPRPLRKSSVLRWSLHPILEEMKREKCGFHAFRRFRTAHHRTQPVPEILLRIWMGHSTRGITDRYALEGVKRNTLFRTMTAQKADLGFELHPVAPTLELGKLLKNWSGREDLNLRPPGPEPGALPG
jgi:integrase